jgi:hypothetical protein
MDTHCVRTGEDALLLYIIPKGELQEKQKWEDGGERHFVPHKCGSYLQKKHICVLWWQRSLSLGGTEHLSPSSGRALRKANHFTTKQGTRFEA